MSQKKTDGVTAADSLLLDSTVKDLEGKILKRRKLMSPQEKVGIFQVSEKITKNHIKGNLFGENLDRDELDSYFDKNENSFSTVYIPDIFSRTALKLEADEKLDFIDSSDDSSPIELLSDLAKLKSRYTSKNPTSHLLPSIQSNQKTLVLDLDETLVHATLEQDSSFVPNAEVDVIEGESYHVYVNFRPGVYEFLDTLVEHFEIVIFTASLPSYASKVLDILEKTKPYFKHRLYRASCTEVQYASEKYYLKDLERLGRDLAKTIIIDNSIHVFSFQIDNGIPIGSWFNDAEDKELEKLSPFLLQLKEADDVRPLISEKYKLSYLVESIENINCK